MEAKNYYPVKVYLIVFRCTIQVQPNTDKIYRKENLKMPFNHFGKTEVNS